MIRRFFTSSAPSRKTVFRPSVTGHWLPVPSSKLDLRYGAFPPPAASAPLRVRRALRDEDALRKEGYVGLDSGEKAEVERKKKEAEAVRAAEASGQASTVKGKEKEKLVIQGVEIPNRPAPPGPEECCMSGCAFCVYDIYADSLTEYKALLKVARRQLLDKAVPASLWPPDLAPPSAAAPVAGEQHLGEAAVEARDAAEEEVDAVIKGLDPTMKAFLEMERKLKKRKREREAKAAKTIADAQSSIAAVEHLA